MNARIFEIPYIDRTGRGSIPVASLIGADSAEIEITPNNLFVRGKKGDISFNFRVPKRNIENFGITVSLLAVRKYLEKEEALAKEKEGQDTGG